MPRRKKKLHGLKSQLLLTFMLIQRRYLLYSKITPLFVIWQWLSFHGWSQKFSKCVFRTITLLKMKQRLKNILRMSQDLLQHHISQIKIRWVFIDVWKDKDFYTKMSHTLHWRIQRIRVWTKMSYTHKRNRVNSKIYFSSQCLL